MLALGKLARFQALTRDPAERRRRSRESVRAYFGLTRWVYRYSWGESWHFGLFSGNEPLEEGVLAAQRRLVAEGGFGPGARLLDVGCGVGGPATSIARLTGADVTGVTIVEEHAREARARAARLGLADRVRFLAADGQALPFPDASFDAVYQVEAGCMMPDKSAFYRECARVLRPGGVFVAQEWMEADGLTAERRERTVEPICRYYACPELTSPSGARRDLADAGFVVESVVDLGADGALSRNWDLLDRKVARTYRIWTRYLVPPGLRLAAHGAEAAAAGARAGAFTVGAWRARRPAQAADSAPSRTATA